MSQIYFYQANRNKIVLVISLLAAASVLVGTFELIPFSDPKINRYLNVAGFLIIMIYNSRMFWYKNYVEWNGKGVHIRIKSFFGKSVRFEDVSSVSLDGPMLAIAKTDGGRLLIDLTGIEQPDMQKLLGLFRGKGPSAEVNNQHS